MADNGANDANGIYQYGADDDFGSGKALLNKLAASISTRLNDGGWQSLTRGGATAITGGTVRYRKVGREVWVEINLTGTFVSGTGYAANATASMLPAAARPSTDPSGRGQIQANGIYPCSCTVGTDGSITVTQTSGSNRTSIQGVFKFPVG